MDCQEGTGEAGSLCTFAIKGDDHTCSVFFPPPEKTAPLKGDRKPTHAKKKSWITAYCPLVNRLMKRKPGQASADAQQIVTSWRQKRTLMIQLVGQKKCVQVSHAQAAITSHPSTPSPSSPKF